MENKIQSDDYSGRTCDIFSSQIEILKQILSQSTPLIPEIEKAMNFQSEIDREFVKYGITHKSKEKYISNLKLNI